MSDRDDRREPHGRSHQEHGPRPSGFGRSDRVAGPSEHAESGYGTGSVGRREYGGPSASHTGSSQSHAGPLGSLRPGADPARGGAFGPDQGRAVARGVERGSGGGYERGQASGAGYGGERGIGGAYVGSQGAGGQAAGGGAGLREQGGGYGGSRGSGAGYGGDRGGGGGPGYGGDRGGGVGAGYGGDRGGSGRGFASGGFGGAQGSGGGYQGSGRGGGGGGYGGGGQGGYGGGYGGGGGPSGYGGGGGRGGGGFSGGGRGGGRGGGPEPKSQIVETGVITLRQRAQLKCDGPDSGERNLQIARPTLGETLNVLVNHFALRACPGARFTHRYEVNIVPQRFGGGSVAAGETLRTRKRLEVERSRAVVSAAASLLNLEQHQFAFDGGHMLLATRELPAKQGEIEVAVGRAKFMLTYSHIEDLDLAEVLTAFFERRTGTCLDDRSRKVLQALDVVLRHCVSLMPKVLMRGSSAFFPDARLKSQERQRHMVPLGEGAHMALGFRAAMAVTDQGLTLTVDTSATAFIKQQPMIDYIISVLDFRGRPPPQLSSSDRRKLEKKLKGMQVTAVPEQREPRPGDRVLSIKGLADEGARDFEFTMAKGGQERTLTISQYFAEKYKRRLQFEDWPVARIGGPAAMPLEVLYVVPHLPKKKPSTRQTPTLVKESAFAPSRRMDDIMEITQNHLHLVEQEALGRRIMAEFGMALDERAVSQGLMRLPARVLPLPALAGSWSFNPKSDGFYGRTGAGFYRSGKLSSWVVLSLVGRNEVSESCGVPRGSSLEGFVDGLMKALERAGVELPTTRKGDKMPPILFAGEDDVPPVVSDNFFDEVLAKGMLTYKKQPQLAVVLLDGSGSSFNYGPIKRQGFECGLMTQCVSLGKAKLGRSQGSGPKGYLENLVLKINAKLGGANFVLADPEGRGQTHATWRPEPLRGERLCIMAIDVNHDSESQPSVAAVVASVDDACSQYIAQVVMQSDPRQELVHGIAAPAKKLLQHYAELNKNKGPSVILLLRDGVGDTQIAKALEVEALGVKKVCQELGYDTKLVVLTAQKRHNHRVFPDKKRDRGATQAQGKDHKGNVMPGTVVEGLGNFKVLDFLLVSYAGSIGTCRGVRYIKALDEIGLTPDEVQRLAYWLSYMCCRCERPVSLCAPIFYAHLAAKRGRDLLSNRSDTSSDASFRPRGSQRLPPPPPLSSVAQSSLTAENLQALGSQSLPGPPPLLPSDQAGPSSQAAPASTGSGSAVVDITTQFEMVNIERGLAKRMWMV